MRAHTHFHSFHVLTAFLLVLATIFLSDLRTLELPKKSITEASVCLGGVGPVLGEMVGFTPDFTVADGDLIGDLTEDALTCFVFPESDSFLLLAVPFSLGLEDFFRDRNVSSESVKSERK